MQTRYRLRGNNDETRDTWSHTFATEERARFWFGEYERLAREHGAPTRGVLVAVNPDGTEEVLARYE